MWDRAVTGRSPGWALSLLSFIRIYITLLAYSLHSMQEETEPKREREKDLQWPCEPLSGCLLSLTGPPHANTVLRGLTLSLLFKARPLADMGGGSAFFRDPSLRFAALGALHVGARLYFLLSHWTAFLKNASPACPVLRAPCGSAEVFGCLGTTGVLVILCSGIDIFHFLDSGKLCVVFDTHWPQIPPVSHT